MSLELHGLLTLGSLRLEAHLEVGDEIVAVTGANGIGKTSLLRLIAGLLALDCGSLRLHGRLLDDAASGLLVPPHRRQVGLMFQDHVLFPFSTALENVAFPLRRQGLGATEARSRAQRQLDHYGIGALADRRPQQLSGGEAQRVALARALVGRPAALLLDEPLSALDAGARAGFRRLLRDQLSALPGPKVLVSHDQLDIAQICDRAVTLCWSGSAVVIRPAPP
jgi:molybdate transport system ATP-binding protein